MKGQASYPFTMIEAAFTFLLVIGVALSAQAYTSGFLAEETADIRADRISNAAETLSYYPNGEKELDIDSYQLKVDGSTVELEINNRVEEARLSGLRYGQIDGPTEFEETSGVCLVKNQEDLEIITEEC